MKAEIHAQAHEAHLCSSCPSPTHLAAVALHP